MTDLHPVTLSSKAAAEVQKIMRTKNIPAGYGLRIGIRGGKGCGAAQFILGFDKKRDSDLVYTEEGVQVFLDKKHTLYVIGKQVDFHDGADARGFVFVDKE